MFLADMFFFVEMGEGCRAPLLEQELSLWASCAHELGSTWHSHIGCWEEDWSFSSVSHRKEVGNLQGADSSATTLNYDQEAVCMIRGSGNCDLTFTLELFH